MKTDYLSSISLNTSVQLANIKSYITGGKYWRQGGNDLTQRGQGAELDCYGSSIIAHFSFV